MKLQTQIPLNKPLLAPIDYKSKILLLGSCFSENIGKKFDYFKFQSLINPFGILFHPLAIENLIRRALNFEYYTDKTLSFSNEQWCCLDTHSKLNKGSKNELLKTLNTALTTTQSAIKEASHIIITLGTSWVYRHIASNTIAANCHKIPQNQFLKELLSVETIVKSLETIISLVHSTNPKVQFIITVSPVRHIKNGFIENTQSKSHLITAIHNLINQKSSIANRNPLYFPSYEIMMDELRDYRFYNADMIHPNEVAIDYIWEKFKSVWLSEDTHHTLNKINSIQKRKAHSPLNANSTAHQQFLAKLQSDIDALRVHIPHIQF